MEEQSLKDLFTDILENNIKFKNLLVELGEEFSDPTKKAEITHQLTLLSEILENKINSLKKQKHAMMNPDFEKLRNNTRNSIEAFKKIKFGQNFQDYVEREVSQYADESDDQNLIEEEKFVNYDQIPFEKEEEIKEIALSIQDIQKMYKETGELVIKNQEALDLIEVEARHSKIHTEEVVKEMKVAANEAIKSRKNYLKLIFATLGGLIGIQGGPAGVAVGGVAGGCVGGVTSMSLNPLQSKIKKIDEKK